MKLKIELSSEAIENLMPTIIKMRFGKRFEQEFYNSINSAYKEYIKIKNINKENEKINTSFDKVFYKKVINK